MRESDDSVWAEDELPIDIPDSSADGLEKKQKTKPPKVVGYAPCPECTNGKVGVIASGSHRIWKEHTYPTWGTARIQCRASGAPLCITPPRLEGGVIPIACSCQPPPWLRRT